MSRTISNIYTYSFNPQLVIKTQVENHDKEPKDRRNFYMWTIIFQKDRYISFLVTLFFNWSMSIYSKYKLHLQWSLYTGVHLLQFLNVVICTPIALFFKYIKPHQIQRTGTTPDATKKGSFDTTLKKNPTKYFFNLVSKESFVPVTVPNLKGSYNSRYIRLIVYFLIIDTNRCKRLLVK